MNASACVSSRTGRLIEARFVRPLNDGERGKLEGHLVSCHACAERYRRLQLAERVAAHGPEEGLFEPSAFEIERIAGDLGLLEPPKRAWRLSLSAPMIAVTASVAVCLAALVVVLPTADDQLVPRGEISTELSFAAYAIDDTGAVRPLERTVSARDHLKLRASWADGAARSLAAVRVVMVSESGEVRVEALGRPVGESGDAFDVATVPGTIALKGLTAGSWAIYVVGGDVRTPLESLGPLVRSRPTAARLNEALEGAQAQRFDVLVEP